MSGRLDRIGTEAFLRVLCPPVPSLPHLMIGVATLLAAASPKIMSPAEIARCLYGAALAARLHEGGCKGIRLTVARLRAQGVPIRTHHRRGYSYPREAGHA